MWATWLRRYSRVVLIHVPLHSHRVLPTLTSITPVRPPSLAALVARAAHLYGSRHALAGHVGLITYDELDGLARRWATALRAYGVPEGGRVGILGNRSRVTYIGALAAAYAGTAFVPLNSRLHVDRIQRIAKLAELDAVIVAPDDIALLETMLEDVGAARVILAPESRLASRIGSGAGAVPWCDADALPTVDLPPCLEPRPEWGCYLLFTSGTTGTPKGVLVTQGNVAAYLREARARFAFLPDDRFSQMFEQSFDVSIFDLFVAWASGACVHTLAAQQLLAPASYIEREGITVYASVPSVLSLMKQRGALRPGRFPAVRYSMFAGEALSVENAKAWAAAAPNSRIDNQYGPTETTVVATGFHWLEREAVSYPNCIVPIGKPFSGVTVRIVGEDGNDVAPGEAGELLVGGDQTVPGYWRDELLTREKFVDGFYRTGDLVRSLPSGDLSFIGRVDDQLKVLGRRVEPAEIEAIARQVPEVTDAVVVGWPLEEGRPVALALFILASGASDDVSTSVARHISTQVEPFLVPRSVKVWSEFPLNANGKVDRRALLATLQVSQFSSS